MDICPARENNPGFVCVYLNVTTHVQLGQHLVTLVQDKVLQVLEVQLLAAHQSCKHLTFVAVQCRGGLWRL